MGAIEHLTIPVPVETADAMRSQVASGHYANLGELVEAALASLTLDRSTAEHAAADEELKAKITKAYEGWRRDPTSALPLKEALAKLKAEGRSAA